MTVKVELQTKAGDRFLVRMYPPGREFVSHYEPALLRGLYGAGASVPEPIASSCQGPRPYLVYRMIPGKSLDQRIDALSDLQVRRVAEACVEQLRILSNLPADGWGDLVSSTRANQSSWAQFVASTAAAVEPIRMGPQLARATHFLRRISRNTADRSSLAWTDLSPENIIVDRAGRFTGIVDLESVMALEPAATRGYLSARYTGTRFGALFQEALDSWVGGSLLDPVYAVIRGLRLLPYQGTLLPGGHARDPLDVLLPGLEEAARTLVLRAE
jgi:aminoglycoside phosphotransferase (APT) family kinase protein